MTFEYLEVGDKFTKVTKPHKMPSSIAFIKIDLGNGNYVAINLENGTVAHNIKLNDTVMKLERPQLKGRIHSFGRGLFFL